MPILLACLFVSCVNTTPNPIVGAYEIGKSDSSTGRIYELLLTKDGTFTLIQYAGANSTKSIIYTGSYELNLGYYDFFKSSGTIIFNPKTPEKLTVENGFFVVGTPKDLDYSWELDKKTGIATIQIEGLYLGKQVNETAFAKSLETEKSGGAYL